MNNLGLGILLFLSFSYFNSVPASAVILLFTFLTQTAISISDIQMCNTDSCLHSVSFSCEVNQSLPHRHPYNFKEPPSYEMYTSSTLVLGPGSMISDYQA